MERVDDATDPILHEVRNIADGIAVREQIPTPGAVAIVVEPGAEDEICSDTEEYTRKGISSEQSRSEGDSHDKRPSEETPIA